MLINITLLVVSTISEEFGFSFWIKEHTSLLLCVRKCVQMEFWLLARLFPSKSVPQQGRIKEFYYDGVVSIIAHKAHKLFMTMPIFNHQTSVISDSEV